MATTAKTTMERADALDERFGTWFRRRRHVVGPPLLALALVVVAYLVWALSLHLYATVLTAFVVAIGTIGAAGDLPLADDTRWWRRNQERIYAWAAWLLGAGWLTFAWWWGPLEPWSVEAGPDGALIPTGRGWLVLVLAAVLTPFWILWFKHRRIRKSVDVDRMIAAWGDGSNAGMPGVKIRGVRYTPGVVTGELVGIRGKHTRGSFTMHKPQIASRFGVTAAQVQLHPGKEEARCAFTVLLETPESAKFELPPADESITVPKLLGQLIGGTGRKIMVQLWRAGHGTVDGLTVGMKGSGKSNRASVVGAYGVRAPDCLVWVADFKPGAQQWAPWGRAGMLDWLITTHDEVLVMLDVLGRIMESRGKTSGKIFKPSTKAPMILLIIDEMALLFGITPNPNVDPEDSYDEKRRVDRFLEALNTTLENHLNVSRSLGFAMHGYLQRAMGDAAGTTTIRAHLGAGVLGVFRVQKAADARLVTDLDADADISPADISPKAAGQSFSKLPDTDGEFVRMQDVFFTDDHFAELVTAMRGIEQPTLEPAALQAAGPAYATRNRTAPDTGVVLVVDAAEDQLELPAAKRLTREESQQLVWRGLRTFGKKGAGPKAVAEKIEKSEQIVKSRLDELKAMGAVEHPRVGRWVALDWPGGDEAEL